MIAALCCALMSTAIDRLERPDGITLLVAESRGLPRVSFRVALRTGGAEDPDALLGLTRIHTELLMRGTENKSRRQFNELIEGYGSSLSGDASAETQAWGGESLSRYFEPTFAMLAEALTKPAFAQPELEKLVRELEADRLTRRDDDASVGRLFFRHFLYPQHVYGRDPLGATKTLASITREHLLAEHKRRFVKGNMVVVAAGDVSLNELSALVDKYLGKLPAGPSLVKDIPPMRDPQGIKLYVIDKPERTQTQIIIGRPALKGPNPDHLALNVAATSFGGTFTAPLMHEVREVRGWSYGAYAAIAEMRGRGGFSMSATPAMEDSKGCLELMVELYRKLYNGGYPESLFEFGRGYLLNQYPFSVATADSRVAEYLHAELLGYHPSWVATYPERLAALKMSDVRDMPRRYLSDNDFIIVVVGTWAQLKKDFASLAFAPQIEVLAYDKDPP